MEGKVVKKTTIALSLAFVTAFGWIISLPSASSEPKSQEEIAVAEAKADQEAIDRWFSLSFVASSALRLKP